MERTTIAKTLLTNINTKMQKDGVMIVKPEKNNNKKNFNISNHCGQFDREAWKADSLQHLWSNWQMF